jgi:hypothetical protein
MVTSRDHCNAAAVHHRSGGKIVSGLAESLANVKGRKPDLRCTMLKVMEQLDAEDRSALEAVMESDASTRGIHKALAEWGIEISRDSITLHRENRCRCTRQEQS